MLKSPLPADTAALLEREARYLESAGTWTLMRYTRGRTSGYFVRNGRKWACADGRPVLFRRLDHAEDEVRRRNARDAERRLEGAERSSLADLI